MFDPVVVLIDFIVFLLACAAFVLSVLKLTVILKGSTLKFGWWWLLPAILVWTSVVRGLYVLVAIGVIPQDYYQYITASQIVFYVGIVLFLWDFYKAAIEALRIEDEQEHTNG